ncbi:MAG: hypothetical protein Q7R62_00585 [bacterium]|nr:hypothetical protein [bacterium]
MHRKFVKQLIYGFFFLLVLALFVWLFYLAFLQPAPTCSDNKKNQDEIEVDCGGPNCGDCELKRIQSVRTFPALALSSSDSKRSTLLIQFQNPNANYGVNPLSYIVNLYGKDGGVIYTNTTDTFIYPSEITYRIEPNIPVSSQLIARSEIVIRNQEWVKRSDFSAPKTQIRDVRVELDEARRSATVSGVFKNDNPFTLSRAVIGVVLYGDTGSLAGLSKTLLDGLQPLEERSFTIIVPVSGITASNTIAEPKVFVEAKR